jgi:mRNA interferase RelE/StbE
MHSHIFRPSVEKYLSKLNPKIRTSIIKKLEFYLSQKNPLDFAEKIHDNKVGEYRFRIGDYRVVFDLVKGVIAINTIDRRDKIYK